VSHNGAPGSRRRVVIVGGGFGGLAAARRLKDADVDVTVIDRKHHHLFQPLLYQVALGSVAPGECATPIRMALRRNPDASVLMAEVVDFDVERQDVVLERGERIGYDSLILACGMETSYFGHDEWKDATCGLKTLGDAVELRDRIFGAFEEAERATDPDARAEWLTVVVVGGGPTGVEVAGAVALQSKRLAAKDFARFAPEDIRVVLLDAGDRVLSPFSEPLSAKAARGLAEIGVEVREGVRATAIERRHNRGRR
jgi:NADH:ubiquinone reductase (H+-translocating)